MYGKRQDDDTGQPPLVSVVMANFEAGEKLDIALASVLAQTVTDLEVIVCDDASSDDSLDRIATFAARDGRVRLVRATANAGPAIARNRGLDCARGTWIAIVDSDDIIHPERLERLLAAAQHFSADIVADDLLHFHEDASPARLLLSEDTPFAVSPERWLRAGLDGTPPLGYLKPIIRAETLGALRYDTSLRIGEDFDLLLRLLLAGARMTVVPEPFYLYRRHAASISHRLSTRDIEAMLESQDSLVTRLDPLPKAIVEILAERRAQLLAGLDFERLVAGVKARDALSALDVLMRRPALAARLWQSFAEGRQRRAASAPVPGNATELDLADQDLPAYVPASEVDWAAPTQRQLWRALADEGQGRSIAASGRAASYAAGFIPLARAIESDMPLALAVSAP